jgi:hypothetical protein
MGGKNPFLGIAYVVVGGLCIVLGVVFTIAHLFKPRHVQSHYLRVSLKTNSGTGNWEIIPICHGTITTRRQQESQLAETPEQVHSMISFQVDRLSQYHFQATMLTRRIGLGTWVCIRSLEDRYECHGSISYSSSDTMQNLEYISFQLESKPTAQLSSFQVFSLTSNWPGGSCERMALMRLCRQL